jgi:DNA-binding winged helix-turn-helix (wHTH) protein
MLDSAVRRKFLFGEFELFPVRPLLLRSSLEVDLAAKAFDALVLLVERSPGLG